MSEQLNEILIVEDEPLIAEDIAETLKESGYGVIGIAHNADDAIRILKSSSPSLALLDIKIDGYIDGLMLAKIVKDEFKLPFMFLTSYTDKETLDKVKELNPYGFIVKPFDERELTSNIELAIHKFKSEGHLLASVENAPEGSFFLKKDSTLHKVMSKDILYAQAFDNYCYIITEKDKFLLPQTLKSVSQKLEAEDFVRIHRSYLVNLSSIDSISEDKVKVKDTELPLSKGSKAELMSRISLL